MTAEWRAAVATVPVLLTVALYVDFLTDDTAWWVHGPRAMATTASVLGLAACVLGARAWTHATVWVGAPLGTAALLFAVFTIATGDGVTLGALVGLIVVLWLAATIRYVRALAGRP